MGNLGTSFGTAAGDYVKGRPGYLPDAVDWLLAGVTGAVADVGAGTGKLTAVIASRGHAVTAVDPDAAMLEALRAQVPGVATIRGRAEALPFADASLGAVTFGQAWHWVDVPVASAEAARVLQPGGVLGLVWNVRDESVAWVAALGAAMGASAAESLISADEVRVAPPFGELAERTWRWEHTMTGEEIHAMVRSRSYFIAGDAQHRARVDAAVRDVLERRDGADTFPMPYVTHAFRATRP